MSGTEQSDAEADGGLVVTQLEQLAHEVNEICRSATLDLAFRVGELIITRLFQRDATLWKDAERTPSYRALAASGELMLSPSALCRAVSIYVLVERLGGRQRWRHLSASHFQEVLSLPAASQDALLAAAEAGEWTVSRLREAAVPRRRRRQSGTVRIARSLEKLSSRLAEHAQELSRAHPDELRDESICQLRGALEVVHRELSELQAQVEQCEAAGAPESAAIARRPVVLSRSRG